MSKLQDEYSIDYSTINLEDVISDDYYRPSLSGSNIKRQQCDSPHGSQIDAETLVQNMCSHNPDRAGTSKSVEIAHIMSQFHDIMSVIDNDNNDDVRDNCSINGVVDLDSDCDGKGVADVSKSTRKAMLAEVDKKISDAIDILNDRSLLSHEPLLATSKGILLDEVGILRHTNGALKHALNEERSAREAMEHQIQSLQHELSEMKAEKDIADDSHEVDLIRLKGQIRMLASSHSISDIYDCFEADMDRLQSKNCELLACLSEMEEAHYSSYINLIRQNNTNIHTDNASEISPDGSVYLQKHEVKQKQLLLNKLRKVSFEKEELRRLYEQLKGQERRFHLHAAIVHDSSRRLKYAYQESMKMKEEMDCERCAKKQAQQELLDANIRLQSLQASDARSKEDAAALAAEVHGLKARISYMMHDYNQLLKFSKYVEKHANKPAISNSNAPMSYKLDNHITFTHEVLQQLEAKHLSVVNCYAASSIDEALAVMHTRLLSTDARDLLPVYRRVVSELQHERENQLLEKHSIFDSLYADLYPHMNSARKSRPEVQEILLRRAAKTKR